MEVVKYSTTPWQAAFVAFCNGTPEDEIAQIFSIPLSTLKVRMSREGWAVLKTKLPLGPSADELPAVVNAKLALMTENRNKNLKVFVELRDDLLEVIEKLRSGELKLEKQFHNKGSVVRADCDPSIVDRVNLATYAQTIAQGTYRALGDFQAQGDKPGQDLGPGSVSAPQAAITIILPGAVASPREMREVTDARAGQVIDLRGLDAENLIAQGNAEPRGTPPNSASAAAADPPPAS